MPKIYNFSAGPSVLPESVLARAASELVQYGSTGQSVMEMSHRSKEYEEIIDNCQLLLREIMGIPNNYKVLFLQGGASLQFSMIPMNLLVGSKKCDLIHTGVWSDKAKKEIEKIGDCRVIASGESSNFTKIPNITVSDFDPQADFVYICENNTIYGTKYPTIPNTGTVPLVADLSSCILSEPIDVNRYGLIFAGAQKNMGIAGLTVVIVREDLIGKVASNVPSMLNYQIQDKNDSMFNTPPTYAIYMCKLVLDWLKNDIGGLVKMKSRNAHKAEILYNYLDSSQIFKPTVTDNDCRSLMNITFVTGNKELDARFISEATQAGFINLKGHRLVGGMRASIYNAMTTDGVTALVNFMKSFESDLH